MRVDSLSIKVGIAKFIDSFLDAFSRRLCYACKKTYTEGYYCDFCLEALKFTWSKEGMSRKYLDFDYIELAQILELELPLYPRIYSTTKYNDLTKSLIRDFKYRKPHLSEFWAQWLYAYWDLHADWILSELSWDKILQSDYDLNTRAGSKLDIFVSYVPMHPSKELRREYNQAKLLAEDFTNCFELGRKYLMQTKQGLNLCELDSVKFVPDLILREKNTPSLFNKSKFERLEILDAAFVINPALELYSENQALLLVLDDISTTGSTFLEIFKTLESKIDLVFLSLCN